MARLNVLQAGRMLGYPVRNPEGETLGRLEEFVVDSETGRVVYAILSFKELLRTEEKLFAVPWRALVVAPEGGALILDVPRERLRDAPAFPREEWPDLGDPVWGSTVYRYYYDDEPYWATHREQATVERHPVASRPVYRRTRTPSAAGWAVAALLVLAVLGIAAYVMYPQKTEVAADTLGRGAERAAVAVKETSKDAATTFKVKTALALSKQVSTFDVDVDSNDGVVTLEGDVPSEGVKQVAAAIAGDTAGVDSVVNRLVVTPSTEALPEREQTRWSVADVETRVTVREALQEDPELADQALRVEVQDGLVTLSGRVADGAQRLRAEQIASGVAGVREVVNQIQTVGTTAPGTTAPETTLPESTAPGTTDPGTTAPETTDPGTTDLGTDRPGMTA